MQQVHGFIRPKVFFEFKPTAQMIQLTDPGLDSWISHAVPLAWHIWHIYQVAGNQLISQDILLECSPVRL